MMNHRNISDMNGHPLCSNTLAVLFSFTGHQYSCHEVRDKYNVRNSLAGTQGCPFVAGTTDGIYEKSGCLCSCSNLSSFRYHCTSAWKVCGNHVIVSSRVTSRGVCLLCVLASPAHHSHSSPSRSVLKPSARHVIGPGAPTGACSTMLQ